MTHAEQIASQLKVKSSQATTDSLDDEQIRIIDVEIQKIEAEPGRIGLG